MSYRNKEGYSDPTAGIAISNVMKDYKKKKCEEQIQAEQAAKHRKRVYVASKYAGDVMKNTEDAIRYCRFVIEYGNMPIASHLMYPAILDDNVPEQRFLGTMFGLALLRLCHEVWVFGGNPSPGMKREIEEAKRLQKPIRYFSSELKEV